MSVLSMTGDYGDNPCHYYDVIMTTIASQITGLAVVYSTVSSDADQRKHQSSASLVFVWGIHRDRWIPRAKGQLRGKCFHLMTSSCKNPESCVFPRVQIHFRHAKLIGNMNNIGSHIIILFRLISILSRISDWSIHFPVVRFLFNWDGCGEYRFLNSQVGAA